MAVFGDGIFKGVIKFNELIKELVSLGEEEQALDKARPGGRHVRTRGEAGGGASPC